MRLDQLCAALAASEHVERAEVRGDGAVEITSVQHDSRAVEPGALFCCVPGGHTDGHRFAGDAVRAGAAALLVEHPVAVDAPQIVVDDSRAAMGPAAAAVVGWPSQALDVVGVTGTNGKTTTVHLLRSVLEAAGRSTGLIGTLTGVRTTPEAPELQRALAAFRDEGRRAVTMEVSSHALAQRRVDGTRFAVAVFTNLSRDHLDFHGDMETYFRAKARLFSPELSERAVVNLDDAHGLLLDRAAEIPTVGFSLADAAQLELGRDGSRFLWRGEPVRLALAGSFNVANALAAATAAAQLGIEAATVAAGLTAAGPVSGRFQLIDQGQPFTVVVDYAHTPDGLAQLLEAARSIAEGHTVTVVFGAGGERDAEKRPMMGEMACQGADRVVLTSDNPRGEDPGAIIAQVQLGMDDCTELAVEPDRRAAVNLAVRGARAGDVVVIAGKGHETTQTIGETVIPFDDRVVASEALAAAGWSSR
jgi:UDP-N-acetylmuramoyl-L-alanyl-D-glutamate--2,6-diaminopimelate ligase